MPNCIAYFVHNLADAAVLRRVQMFHAGGAKVIVIGFRRDEKVPANVDGAPVIDLGRTEDGKLLHRIWAVIRNTRHSDAVRKAVAQADVIVARNLEMLAIAANLKQQRRLIYECLDIHRLLLQNGLLARGVQRVERALLAGVDLILTSSPRFEQAYFRDLRHLTIPVLLIENKIMNLDGRDHRANAVAKVPFVEDGPLIIGWFGMLRCRRTFDYLSRLANDSHGRIEVLIAGIPSPAEFPDFANAVAGVPGMRFLGAYTAADLPSLYGRVHFAWAIDYFEEGLNSVWLLPNRLYEALGNGVVPIALRHVETGAWLAAHGVGLVIDDPMVDIPEFVVELRAVKYHNMVEHVAAIPRPILETHLQECVSLVNALG